VNAVFEPLLPQIAELLDGNTQLPEDFEKERRPDFTPLVQRDRHSSPIGMVPALVASCLAEFPETELLRHPLQLSSSGARQA